MPLRLQRRWIGAPSGAKVPGRAARTCRFTTTHTVNLVALAGKRRRNGAEKETTIECDDWLNKLDAETKLLQDRFRSLAAWLSDLRVKL
jgi:hypothetical protein